MSYQISGKSHSGIIFVVAGEDFDIFRANLIALYGDAAPADETIRVATQLVTPGSAANAAQGPPAQQQAPAGPPAYQPQQAPPQQTYQPQTQQDASNVIQGAFPQAQQIQPGYDQRPSAGPPPVQAPFCPNHNSPAKWVPPGVSKRTNKPFQGFWACAVSQQGDNSCRIPS